jgi:RNA polymerase sigma factor (sigma-70 family)
MAEIARALIEFVNDAELLARFNNDRDEDAFRALLEKYLGLVFGVAMRRTKDYALAEDVSQSVFTILAKKAHRLRATPTLAPWLYGCTLIECGQALRRNRAYEKKMKAFGEESKALPGRDVCSEVMPLLDEAIQRLSSKDRVLIILRFFERKSFREIATELGKGEAAVQKRTERAIEKLSDLLKRKGVIIPIAVLTFGLSTELAKAAPVGLAAAIAKGSLGGGSVMTAKTLILKTIKLMINTKAKTTGAVALIASVTICLQWTQNRQLRTELAKATELLETASNPQEPASVSAESESSSPLSKRPQKGNSLRDWQQALYEPDPVVRTARIGELLETLNTAEAVSVAQLFEKAQKEGLQIDEEYRLFLRSWGKRDGAGALAHALDQAGKVYPTRFHPTAEVLAALAGWASADAQNARAWVENLPDESLKWHFVSGLLEGWSISDFQSAAAFAQKCPGGEADEGRVRNDWISVLLQRSLSEGGVPAVQHWIASIPNDETTLAFKQEALGRAVRIMLESDPFAAANSISQSGDASYVTADTLAYTAERLAIISPTEALSWVTTLNGAKPGDVDTAAARVMQSWTLQDSQGAADWLAQNRDIPQYDAMASSYASTLGLTDPVTALAWSRTVNNPHMRNQAEIDVMAQFYARDGTTSGAEPSANGLTDALLRQARATADIQRKQSEIQRLLFLQHD